MRDRKSLGVGGFAALGIGVAVAIVGAVLTNAVGQPPKPLDGGPLPASTQPALIPVTLNKVSPNDGLVLGNGVSLDRIAPAHGSPFEKPRAREVLSDRTVNVRVHVATTTSSVDVLSGVNVGIKARYLFGSAEANLETSRSAGVSADSFRLVLVGEAEYGHDELDAPALKPEAAKLIAAGEMKKFAEVYGTHYVQREHKVDRIVLEIGVDRWSDTTTSHVIAGLKGGVSLPVGGGELSLRIREDLKSASSRGALTVTVRTVGGPGLNAYGELLQATITKNPDLEAIAVAMKKALEGFKRENAGISAVTVLPYTGFDWNPDKQSLWNDEFERKLAECVERHHRGRQVTQSLKVALENAKPPQEGRLKKYTAEYDQYLSRLAEVQKQLLAKNQEFVAKPLPDEPAIDAETARDVLVRYATLEDKIAQLKRLTGKIAELEARTNEAEGQLKKLAWLNQPVNPSLHGNLGVNSFIGFLSEHVRGHTSNWDPVGWSNDKLKPLPDKK